MCVGLSVGEMSVRHACGVQGSQWKNAHIHAERVKGKKNLLYTGSTRAMDQLKISRIDSELDLVKKMELHPETVLWQHEMQPGRFEAERVTAAEKETEKKKKRASVHT